METNKNYLMVGSFVLLLLVGIAIFSVWLIGSYDNHKYTPYRIYFTESVSGLDVGSAVKFRGVTIGKVKSMVIDANDLRRIQVDVNLLKTAPIKTDTIASLKFQGITGGIFVELSGSTPDAPDLVAADDSPPEIRAQISTLTEIMDVLPQILGKVSHIAEQTDKLFNEKNINAFNDMMDNLQKITRDVSQLTHSLKDNPSKLLFPSKETGIPAP